MSSLQLWDCGIVEHICAVPMYGLFREQLLQMCVYMFFSLQKIAGYVIPRSNAGVSVPQQRYHS